MRNFYIFLLFIPQLLNGQSKIITHDILFRNLKSSSYVHIGFYAPENHFRHEFNLISLITKDVISEPFDGENYKGKYLQDDIVTDTATLKKIIEIFDERGLLEKLYVRIDTCYVNVENSNDRQFENKSKLFIDLFYPTGKEFEQVFIPINENDTAIELLKVVSKLFNENEKKLFIDMINVMK